MVDMDTGVDVGTGEALVVLALVVVVVVARAGQVTPTLERGCGPFARRKEMGTRVPVGTEAPPWSPLALQLLGMGTTVGKRSCCTASACVWCAFALSLGDSQLATHVLSRVYLQSAL